MNLSIQNLYDIGERYWQDHIFPSRQYILDIENTTNIIQDICRRIAEHNTIGYCHPVDSLIQVLLDITDVPSDISYATFIDDEHLSDFMVNTILVLLPIITYHMDRGATWKEAIQIIYDNGTLDFFAINGRHLASEDPDTLINSLIENYNT